MSWRNNVKKELPAFGLGDLAPGREEEITVTFEDDGQMTDTKHGQALQIAVTAESVPSGYTDMNGDTMEEGEEYYLMSSSSRFMRAIMTLGDDLTGITASITAEGESESFDRQYYAEQQ